MVRMGQAEKGLWREGSEEAVVPVKTMVGPPTVVAVETVEVVRFCLDFEGKAKKFPNKCGCRMSEKEKM